MSPCLSSASSTASRFVSRRRSRAKFPVISSHHDYDDVVTSDGSISPTVSNHHRHPHHQRNGRDDHHASLSSIQASYSSFSKSSIVPLPPPQQQHQKQKRRGPEQAAVSFQAEKQRSIKPRQQQQGSSSCSHQCPCQPLAPLDTSRLPSHRFRLPYASSLRIHRDGRLTIKFSPRGFKIAQEEEAAQSIHKIAKMTGKSK